MDDFLDWGWRYPFYVAFAINVVALFARLRLVATNEYARLLAERELEPTNVVEMVRAQGSTLVIGAFAALASYALFHLVTVFPLSWIRLYSNQSISEFLVVQMIGAGLGHPRHHCLRDDCGSVRAAPYARHRRRAHRGIQRVRTHPAGRRPARSGYLHPAGLLACWACPTARPPVP